MKPRRDIPPALRELINQHTEGMKPRRDIPRTFRDLINRVGVHRMAAVLDCHPNHVWVMRTRSSIAPDPYWPVLLEAAPKLGLDGLTLRDLHSMRSNRVRQIRSGAAARIAS